MVIVVGAAIGLRVCAGNPRRFKENFLVLVALFGDDAADKLELRLKRD
jgi:hypothetical protein